LPRGIIATRIQRTDPSHCARRVNWEKPKNTEKTPCFPESFVCAAPWLYVVAFAPA
jgi:hypothetical protein